MAFDRKAWSKEYRQRPEVKAKRKAWDKEYNQRPEVKAKRKAYAQRPEVKARHNKKKKARTNASPENFVRNKLWQQKSAAKTRGIVWKLDDDAIIRKILRQGHCKLSGQKFVYKQGTHKNRNLYAPSIDRIDSKKGYVPGNVMFVCWGVNYMKQDLSLYQFKKMCAKVAE